MADQQPGDPTPAAGVPDPTRVEGDGEPSTVDSPARWSGSAAVPPPPPRKGRWSRRRGAPEPDSDDWAAIPAVDPWADQDTPPDAMPSAAHAPLPPTRIEPPPPPTRVDPPPNRVPVQPHPPAGSGRPAAAPPPTPPPASPQASPSAGPPAPPSARSQASPPAPPPRAPRPAQRPLPPAPRKRRRWGRWIALLTLLGFVCCCGLPVTYFQVPAARQYPVTAVLPPTFADLTRRDDDASRRAADRLAQQMGGSGDVFAGVYADSVGKRVTVFGVTGWRLHPGTDVRAQLSRLSGEFRLAGVRSFQVSEAGVYERCGTGLFEDTPVVVCAWADHGSLATVLLTRRSVPESAELVAHLRNAVLTTG